MQVLLIEDNPHWQLKIEAVLHTAAYEVVYVATTITEAEQYLQKQLSPQLIIADIMLHNHVVFELLNTTSIANIPTIVVSTSTQESHLKALKSFNYATLLLKPFHANSLKAAIDTVLALASTKQQLQQVQQQQTTTLNTIAHDLKSPFLNFMGIAKTMKYLLGQRDYTTIDALGEEVEKKSSNLFKLIGNVLKTASHDNINATPTTIATVVHAILPSYADTATLKQVIIHTELSGGDMLCGNEVALSTILRNLIDNAVKHAPQGSTVTLIVKAVATYTAIHISNAAPNASHTQLQQLNLLLQSPTPLQPYTQGIGMGMALVHSHVLQLGASIQVTLEDDIVSFSVLHPSDKAK